MILGDELRIDTPEQVALELPIAGVGSRFLAIVVDTLLQGVLYLLVILLFGAFGPAMIAGASRFWANVLFAMAVLGLFCIYWGYFALFEIVWSGQTPGKRVAKIRVIRESGRPIDVTAAILRNLLRAVDFLPALYGVGVATMVLNRHSRRLGRFARRHRRRARARGGVPGAELDELTKSPHRRTVCRNNHRQRARAHRDVSRAALEFF